MAMTQSGQGAAADTSGARGCCAFADLPLAVVLIVSASASAAPPAAMRPALRLSNMPTFRRGLRRFKNTLILAPLGTLASLLIAYPLAYFLAVRTAPKWKTMLLVLVIVPFWTSILIRTYAWIFILGGQGIPALLAAMSGWRTCG